MNNAQLLSTLLESFLSIQQTHTTESDANFRRSVRMKELLDRMAEELRPGETYETPTHQIRVGKDGRAHVKHV